jgi:hypothetical protein
LLSLKHEVAKRANGVHLEERSVQMPLTAGGTPQPQAALEYSPGSSNIH